LSKKATFSGILGVYIIPWQEVVRVSLCMFLSTSIHTYCRWCWVRTNEHSKEKLSQLKKSIKSNRPKLLLSLVNHTIK
jgi:hypothetical protein